MAIGKTFDGIQLDITISSRSPCVVVPGGGGGVRVPRNLVSQDLSASSSSSSTAVAASGVVIRRGNKLKRRKAYYTRQRSDVTVSKGMTKCRKTSNFRGTILCMGGGD